MIYYCFGPEVGLFFFPAMSAYHIVEVFTYPYVVLRNAVDPELFFSDPSSDPDISFQLVLDPYPDPNPDPVSDPI
jgi:hypothetical protein